MTSAVLPVFLQAPGGISRLGLRFLIDVTLRGTVLLLLAVGSSLALRRASAATRHLVWALALGAVLALPVLSFTLPVWRVPWSGSWPSDPQIEQKSREKVSASGLPGSRSLANPSAPAPTTAPESPTNPPWIVSVLYAWAIGAVVLAARLVAGVFRARGMARRSSRFDSSQAEWMADNLCRRLGVRRAAELRVSAEAAVPFTFGTFRPRILLPAQAPTWQDQQLGLVLTHELAHVKRFDYLTQMLAELARSLFWFHPLVWIAACQMRRERERACDDIVLNLGHPATAYAELLLMLGRGLRRIRSGRVAQTAMVQTSQLEVRMEALLNPKLNHRPLAPSCAVLALAATLLLLLPAAMIRATAKTPTGNISGTVLDPSGAVIPDACVTAINLETHAKIAVHTGEDGSFEFPAIPAGRYRLEITKAGFADTKTADLDLQASSDLREKLVLDIASMSERVIVRGHSSAENTRSPSTPQRIRVGGLVESAKLIHRVSPLYPARAEKEGVEGTVILRAVIATNGEVLSLAPYNDADPVLIQAAMAAVRQWRYDPTLLNGVPVEVVTTVTVSFRLDK